MDPTTTDPPERTPGSEPSPERSHGSDPAPDAVVRKRAGSESDEREVIRFGNPKRTQQSAVQRWRWHLVAVAAIAIVATMAAVTLTSGDDDESPAEEPAPTTTTEPPPPTQISQEFTVAELLPLDGQYGPFLELAEQTGLIEELGGEAEITLLAPTAEALDGSVPDDEAAALRLLRRHVLEGEVGLTELLGRNGDSVATIDGDELPVEVGDNEIRVGGAVIAKSNIMASNGVIHVVETPVAG